jgi:hypothetical protein
MVDLGAFAMTGNGVRFEARAIFQMFVHDRILVERLLLTFSRCECIGTKKSIRRKMELCFHPWTEDITLSAIYSRMRTSVISALAE